MCVTRPQSVALLGPSQLPPPGARSCPPSLSKLSPPPRPLSPLSGRRGSGAAPPSRPEQAQVVSAAESASADGAWQDEAAGPCPVSAAPTVPPQVCRWVLLSCGGVVLSSGRPQTPPCFVSGPLFGGREPAPGPKPGARFRMPRPGSAPPGRSSCAARRRRGPPASASLSGTPPRFSAPRQPPAKQSPLRLQAGFTPLARAPLPAVA